MVYLAMVLGPVFTVHVSGLGLAGSLDCFFCLIVVPGQSREVCRAVDSGYLSREQHWDYARIVLKS